MALIVNVIERKTKIGPKNYTCMYIGIFFKFYPCIPAVASRGQFFTTSLPTLTPVETPRVDHSPLYSPLGVNTP
jgi:hypothetical protein